MPTLQALLQLLDHERRARDEALQALSRAEGAAGQADTQAAASRACSRYGRQCERAWQAAGLGGRRSSGWMPEQGVQRRHAARQARSRTGCHQKARARRCKSSPGVQPGCGLRLSRGHSGGNASGVRSVNRP